MSQLVTVGGMFPKNALGKLAYRADLVGASRSQVVKYLAYIAAGFQPAQAREKVLAPSDRDLSTFAGEQRREIAMVDPAILQAIREKHPGREVSWCLRYYAALHTPGCTEELAVEIASEIHRGRPRKEVKTNE